MPTENTETAFDRDVRLARKSLERQPEGIRRYLERNRAEVTRLQGSYADNQRNSSDTSIR